MSSSKALRVATTADPTLERSRRVWGSGSYDRISAGFRHEGELFVSRLGLDHSHWVLDAACGTGNLTLPAARAGAQVRGLDVVPMLLEVGRERAQHEHLRVHFDEGTVEDMAYPEAAFDVAMSMFGVCFAARPERVADELARVVKPGGRIALANWTAAGFTGRMLEMHYAALPPPASQSSPLIWGDEEAVRMLLGERRWTIRTTLRRLRFRFPHTPRGTAELFRAAYGPTVVTLAAIDEDRRATLHAELTEHWVKHDRGGGHHTEVESEYLELIATRR